MYLYQISVNSFRLFNVNYFAVVTFRSLYAFSHHHSAAHITY